MRLPAGILKPPVTLEALQSAELSLPPIDRGKESIGQPVARFRKERGYTQVELAGKIGILQTVVMDYETDHLRLATMIEVSTDALLQLAGPWSPRSPAARCCVARSRSRLCRWRSRPRCCAPSIHFWREPPPAQRGALRSSAAKRKQHGQTACPSVARSARPGSV